MPMFQTAFGGTSVKFSPFLENYIAVSTAEYFGCGGTGRQHVLEVTPNGMVQIAAFDTPDGLYDCAWSEDNENVLVSASGDGSIKVWDLSAPPMDNPVSNLQEHADRVVSVDWNMVRKDLFLSSSQDNTIRLWTVDAPQSLRTFSEDSSCVYQATWKPRHADIFASVSGDGTILVWDVRQPRSTFRFPAQSSEICTCDWNKYNEFILATAATDNVIVIWDVRKLPHELVGFFHNNQDRRYPETNDQFESPVPGPLPSTLHRLKFSPHQETLLASCSYDTTVCLWDIRPEYEDGYDCLDRLTHHTEYSLGIDMSVFVEGLLASTSLDKSVFVWQMGMNPRAA